MIRSLFDTEDLPEDKNKISEKVENENAESPIAANPAESQITETAEDQDVSIVEPLENQPVFEQSSTFRQTEKEEFPSESLEKEESANLDFRSKPTSFESENIVKDIEFGDNFLELEREVAKIEEEVRLESEEKIEEETNAENSSAIENRGLTENKSEPEKIELKQTQPGIFTAAINKAQQEKTPAVPLENLLVMPDETQNDFVDSSDENQTATFVSANENQGFILLNRIEPKAENTILDQPDETSQTDYKPESKAEIIRKSGLAWSAGIAFFASVVFLLILGWFADLLLGTSPWGAVGGIILGSIIGFIQLFRLTSQILKNNE